MPRDIKMYTMAVAISPLDKKYVRKLREEQGFKSDAGTLAHIIDEYRKHSEKTVVFDDVAAILDLFIKTVNPFLRHGNSTERKCAQLLIDKFGYDDAKDIVKQAIAVQGKKYAPTIGKPSDLIRSWTKLSNFIKTKPANKQSAFV